jgi:hypothetical protein
MKRLWWIKPRTSASGYDKVFRGTKQIALVETAVGGFAWSGMGLHRINLKNHNDVLADVKYFHAHPSKRATTFTFASGRKARFMPDEVIYWENEDEQAHQRSLPR